MPGLNGGWSKIQKQLSQCLNTSAAETRYVYVRRTKHVCANSRQTAKFMGRMPFGGLQANVQGSTLSNRKMQDFVPVCLNDVLKHMNQLFDSDIVVR